MNNMDHNKILIIPAAAYAEINEQFIPEIFKINDTGRMNIISNMIDLPLSDFDKIYIVVNQRIDEIYNIKNMLQVQLKNEEFGDKTCIIVIENTRNVVDTVLHVVAQIPYSKFGVFIKDADASFNITELNNENTVYTYKLEDVKEINPSSKSYVSTTSDDVVLNIIEKRVISSEFCVGGYYFNDIKKFIDLCECVSEYDKLYLSNVIYYDILRNGEIYRTEQVIRFSE